MKTYKELFKELQSLKEDGVIGGPTNVVGGIAGTGGNAGEPGVHMNRKRKKDSVKSPIMGKMNRRTPPN